jgi:hypothetical protein
VVDPKRIIRKMEGRGGGEAQELLTQKTTISDVKNLAHIFSWG